MYCTDQSKAKWLVFCVLFIMSLLAWPVQLYEVINNLVLWHAIILLWLECSFVVTKRTRLWATILVRIVVGRKIGSPEKKNKQKNNRITECGAGCLTKLKRWLWYCYSGRIWVKISWTRVQSDRHLATATCIQSYLLWCHPYNMGPASPTHLYPHMKPNGWKDKRLVKNPELPWW